MSQRFSSFRIVVRNSLFIIRICRKIKAPKFAYLIIKYKLKNITHIFKTIKNKKITNYSRLHLKVMQNI